MKNGELSILFSVQGTGGSPTGPDPENRVGDQVTYYIVKSVLEVVINTLAIGSNIQQTITSSNTSVLNITTFTALLFHAHTFTYCY